MDTPTPKTDERVAAVRFVRNMLPVDLKDIPLVIQEPRAGIVGFSCGIPLFTRALRDAMVARSRGVFRGSLLAISRFL
ncbi:MAG: hypothetical protein KGJ02_08110, partial [Verrucomicrobiota bacterium]|nr:hypothetical protein [Verrucomicrobiota bacterium]